MKNAFIVRDKDAIPPLGAPASEAVLLGEPLFEAMKRRLEAFRLTVARVDTLDEAVTRAGGCKDGALVTHDSVAFSKTVVHHLIAAARRDSRPVLMAALPEAHATRRLSHLDGMTRISVEGQQAFSAPLWSVRAGAKLEDAAPVLLPYREVEWKLPMPVGMLGLTTEPFGATDTYLVRVDHWAQILRLNLTALVGFWFERWQSTGGKLWFLRRALLGVPWRRGRLAAQLNHVYHGAKIHHTAHVELSVVEPGAEIGANAVVKNSYVGRGARIDDGAVVNACVLSAGAWVATGSAVFASVLYPGAFAAQHKMQFSVLGANSAALTGSYFNDLNFRRGNVHVMHRGRLADSGHRFLSVCLGPWARIAGSFWIAAGRAVPAHALIIQPAANVLLRIDEELAQRRTTSVRDSALVDAGPLATTDPSYVIPDDDAAPSSEVARLT